eukprot:1947451-Amphidinium_carterae.1
MHTNTFVYLDGRQDAAAVPASSVEKVAPSQAGDWVGATRPQSTGAAYSQSSQSQGNLTAHQVSAPAGSDMGTWEYCLPYKLGPPGVPHTSSGYSNSTAQGAVAHCLSTHTRNTRPARVRIDAWIDRDRDRNLASIFVPIHAGAPAQSKAPVCSSGPAQTPGLPMDIHQGSIGHTAQRCSGAPEHDGRLEFPALRLPVEGNAFGWALPDALGNQAAQGRSHQTLWA